MKEAFKQIRIIHFALALGVAMFSFVLIFFVLDLSEMAFKESIFLYIVMLMALIILPLERFFYKRGVNSITEGMDDTEKLQIYQSTKIISWALLEGLALMSLVYTMVKSSWYFLIFAACAWILLLIRHPNSGELRRDFKLQNDFN